MPALVPVHGGLTEPVCRTVPADQIASFVAHAKTLAQVPVSDADLSTVYRLGDGGLSPLTGPMDSKTYHRVLEESVIEHQGKLYAWTIPIALPVTAELAARLKAGQEVALVNSAGRDRGRAGAQRHLCLGQGPLPQDRSISPIGPTTPAATWS